MWVVLDITDSEQAVVVSRHEQQACAVRRVRYLRQKEAILHPYSREARHPYYWSWVVTSIRVGAVIQHRGFYLAQKGDGDAYHTDQY